MMLWHRRRGRREGLASRNTEIYSLGKKDAWKKIEDINTGIYGSVWQKGNKYYYFDNLGIHQLIDNAIYEITDKETLAFLRNNYTKLRKLIRSEKLIAFEGEKKVEIVVKRGGVFTAFYIIFLASIVAVAYFKTKK